MTDRPLDQGPARAFPDEEGITWVATIRERHGTDFKGRYYFFVRPVQGSGDEGYPLKDVRWNSLRTAARTLQTMSEVELRRRLRSARGRSRSPTGEPSIQGAE